MNSQIINSAAAEEMMDARATCRFFGGTRPISVATLYRGIAAGRYPKPVKVASNCSRWLRSECASSLAKSSGRTIGLFTNQSQVTTSESSHQPQTFVDEREVPSVEELELPPKNALAFVSGVYFLFSADALVYVGASTNVLFRIGQHINRGDIVFETYSYLLTPLRKVAAAERAYIRKYRPKYNRSLGGGFSTSEFGKGDGV